MFLILDVSSLFNFPLCVVVETLVEYLVMADFRKAPDKMADNKAFFPFLQKERERTGQRVRVVVLLLFLELLEERARAFRRSAGLSQVWGYPRVDLQD
jgi:hypothetical protein